MENLVSPPIQQLLEKATRTDRYNKSRIGTAGEEAIARYITQKGWSILARNWRPKGALHGLELDIVATDEDTLVFVEVKTRTCTSTAFNTHKRSEKKVLLPNKAFFQMQFPFFSKRQSKEVATRIPKSGGKHTVSKKNDYYSTQEQAPPAYSAFTQQKRQKMLRAAQYFLASEEYHEVPCRFDLFCIDEDNNGKFWIEHYEHVIETGKALDSRNTYWEPW